MASFWEHSITVTPKMDPRPGEARWHYPRVGEFRVIGQRLLAAHGLRIVSLYMGADATFRVEIAVPRLSSDFAADAAAAECSLNVVANARDRKVTPLPAPCPARMVETV